MFCTNGIKEVSFRLFVLVCGLKEESPNALWVVGKYRGANGSHNL